MIKRHFPYPIGVLRPNRRGDRANSGPTLKPDCVSNECVHVYLHKITGL